ncbi:MAG: bifunctional DNA primase/polymerase, partial [Anaerolineae bacterium]|nr:bifunctional DNA primase/polymerase [Anaerolineae bacterium]
MYKPTSDPEMETDNPTLRRRRDRLRASDQDRRLLTDQTERMLAIALAYRAAGYNVIPVARGKKRPYYEHEALQYIQLDEKTLTRVIVMTGGNINLMAVCGYSSAGLFVVDFDDMRYTAYFEAQLCERGIPITGVKSGRGIHYHAQLTDGPVVSVGLQLDLAKKITDPGNHIGDLQAQGSLVVLPGSLHESTSMIYEALPGTLRNDIAHVARIPYAAIAGIEFAPGRQLTLGRNKRDMRPRALRLPEFIKASTPEGTRNELLFKSTRWLRDNGFTADDALHVLTSQDCGAPAINCGLPIREIERTVESVYSRQTTAQVDADRATQHEAACYAYLRTRD